jgi:amidase
MAAELLTSDAIAQAQAIRRGEVSAAELVEAAAARAETVDHVVNALVTPLFEQALAAARGPLPDGPLRGVPFLLKDLVATAAGVPHHEGSRFLAGYVADEDSEFVRRCRRAGLVLLGTANTPEFGCSGSCEPVFNGPTRNPWDLSRSPGGSSGGSAAAVAGRAVAISHGNDFGGSLRVPAACCGLVSLKPTRGRNPLGPKLGEGWSGIAAEHVITRSVRDNALMLDITSGPSVGDPYWAPPPGGSFLERLRTDRKLRIAVTAGDVHPDCAAATREAARLCESLGHEVSEAEPEYDVEAAGRAGLESWADGTAAWIADWAERLGREPGADEIEPVNTYLREFGLRRSAADHVRTVNVNHRVGRQLGAFFERFDVWLTPTLATPPVPLGYLVEGDPQQILEREGAYYPYLFVASQTGQPSMSVPFSWNEEGLPIGIHLMGGYGDDLTLLQLAAQIEEERPWADRLPTALEAALVQHKRRQ